MAEHPPHALRTLDRGRRAGAFDRLARGKLASGEVERQGNEMRDLADGRASGCSSAKDIPPALALNWIKCTVHGKGGEVPHSDG